MLKRIADWLEKMSVGAMLVGLFQGQRFALYVGMVCFVSSLVMGHWAELVLRKRSKLS